jgi:hypothetical protein
MRRREFITLLAAQRLGRSRRAQQAAIPPNVLLARAKL